MRKIIFGLLAYLLVCVDVMAVSSDKALVAEGEYLATAADCVACHTAPGEKPFAGGLAFELPFGTLYTPNITPDAETGIGDWTDDEFVRALQEGISREGEHYYPAFPYTSYTKMPREDILAIKAYLFSLEPVHQPARENDIGFPFNQRWGMYLWNFVFLDDKRFQPDLDQSEAWNRGAYLVNGPGHCGECHTPRNIFQATQSSELFAGADIGGWRAYNITSSDSHGIGQWSEDQLVSYFSEGYAEGHGVAGGPMAEVVEYSLRHLSESDLRAIATYLKATDPKAVGVPRPAVKPKLAGAPLNEDLGSKIFADACVSCHQWDGRGNQSPTATLSGLKTVSDPRASNLLGILLEGNPASSLPVNHRMPDFGAIYNDQELAALATFVLSHFGRLDTAIEPEQVGERRSLSLH
ncbi:cytochrome c [Marinobacter salexigens]|uniref:c-type cytochrome n=1 Tax=Marinobacter salexigens TaxID=1925763 RepID=UPI001961F848